MFNGSLVALITPFKNGAVDEKGFEKFVAWQIKEGTDGLVPCGTTGEAAISCRLPSSACAALGRLAQPLADFSVSRAETRASLAPLLEAAVIQWSWKEERFPHLDQYTSLHERLVAKWRDIAPLLPPVRVAATLHFDIKRFWEEFFIAHSSNLGLILLASQ